MVPAGAVVAVADDDDDETSIVVLLPLLEQTSEMAEGQCDFEARSDQ